MDIFVQSFDIPIIVSIFCDNLGLRWWTKAWFNNSEKGEPSHEITRPQAIQFIRDEIDKEAWLRENYPKQMEIRDNALEQTREQLMQMSV